MFYILKVMIPVIYAGYYFLVVVNFLDEKVQYIVTEEDRPDSKLCEEKGQIIVSNKIQSILWPFIMIMEFQCDCGS